MADAIQHGVVPSPFSASWMVPALSRALNSLSDSDITANREQFAKSVNFLLQSLCVRICIPSRELCVLNLAKPKEGTGHICFRTLTKRNRGQLGTLPINLAYVIHRQGIPTAVKRVLAPFNFEIWEVLQ